MKKLKLIMVVCSLLTISAVSYGASCLEHFQYNMAECEEPIILDFIFDTGAGHDYNECVKNAAGSYETCEDNGG